jgi:predicted Fe-Mo cluster-binding NifX family protein
MSYRIAVATTDGKVVNEHFGRARQFLILTVSDDGTYEPVEVRNFQGVCEKGSHEEENMRKTVEELSDCKYVLVSRIGQGAEAVLEQAGITAYIIPDLIENAIEKLISYIEINKLIYGSL